MKCFFLTIILFTSVPCFAWEVDNFTHRYQLLQDSTEILNQNVSLRLEAAAKIANLGTGCDKRILAESVHSQFASFILGRVEAYAEYSSDVERIKVDFNDSIYKKPYDAPLTLTSSGVCSNIDINKKRLGTDKLGHFFDQGYELYIAARGSRKNTLAAVKYGVALETGIYGAVMTSIKSYADLVANYEGFLFWTNLSENKNPYYICEDSKWVLNRSFDWKDYVTDAWDEAVNCSSFTSSERTSAIKFNAYQLELKSLKEDGVFRKYQCPAKPIQCKILNHKYGKLSPYLLGPDCLR